MALTSGTRLGAYQILASLGAGGMGEVYRARDTRLGREVALKVLPSDVARDAERLARFEREARTVAALNHPNIVVLHGIEDVGDVRFLIMELVEGHSLDRHVIAGGMPVVEVLDVGISIADALTTAHEKGVIHRDLKPANVMRTGDGRVKVLDFGIAKLVAPGPTDLDSSVAATRSLQPSAAGQVVGTPAYMAPEQIRGEAVDARTDVFALGILIYELAAGSRPFLGASAADVTSAILRDTPEPLLAARSGLPADLDRIVGRCLEKSPRERFQTALDVGNELRALRRALERGEPPGNGADRVASIAILPFANRSASAEDEYFSDGLADELLTVLAKIPGLRVAARTSAFSFKGKDVTIAEVGRVLKVGTVLEGSVRKSGRRVRISVQLVKVADGYQLWSQTYDRTLDDIFAVQDDIAQSVVNELRAALLGAEAGSDARAEVARAAKGRTKDPEAHRVYLMARYLLDRFTRDFMVKGIAYLEQALERDPHFALAWAESSRAYAYQADAGWVPAAEGYGRARDAAERALALEPELAEAHAALGWVRRTFDWDWAGSQESYRRALLLAPGDATVLRRAGALASTLGDLDRAIDLSRRAAEQDPLSAPAHHNLGLAYLDAQRIAEAEATYRKVLELAPQRIATRAYLSIALVAQGRAAEALTEAERESEDAYRLWALVIVRHEIGDRAASDAALRELIEKYAEDSAFQIAEVHAVRHELDAAFDWLDRACAQRDAGIAEMKTSSRLRPLHADSRWAGLLRRLGLET